MPMIDVYAAEGTFNDRHALARDLAAALIRWEKVPAISLFQNNISPEGGWGLNGHANSGADIAAAARAEITAIAAKTSAQE